MKQILLFITLSIVVTFSANCQSLIPEAKIMFTLPNSQWPVLIREMVGERILYSSKQTQITDKAGRKVVLNIGIILESTPENVRLKAFSAALLEDLQIASAQGR